MQKDGYTALHMAAVNDHAEVVKELLKAQDIDVNLKNVRDLLLQHPRIHVSFASIYGVRIYSSLRLLSSRDSSLCDM